MNILLLSLGCGVTLLGVVIISLGMWEHTPGSAPIVDVRTVTERVPELERMRSLNARPGEIWSMKGGGFVEIMEPYRKDGLIDGFGVYHEGPGPHAQDFYTWRKDGTLTGTGWIGHELSLRVDKPSVYGGKYPDWWGK